MSYSFRLTARVLLYASSHRQDSTYHSLWYTSGGALAGTRNNIHLECFFERHCIHLVSDPEVDGAHGVHAVQLQEQFHHRRGVVALGVQLLLDTGLGVGAVRCTHSVHWKRNKQPQYDLCLWVLFFKVHMQKYVLVDEGAKPGCVSILIRSEINSHQ